nr:hypothetical protein HK105_000860 [Polyrhizophydium stewartii]
MDGGPAGPAGTSASDPHLHADDDLVAQNASGVVARLAPGTHHAAADVAALKPEPAAAAPSATAERYHRTNAFRPWATNEWDRMPAEIQNKVLDAAGPFTKFLNGILLRAELRCLTVQQVEQLWQDAIDTEWQGDFEILPWIDITSASLRISRSVIDKIKHRFSSTQLETLYISNRWEDALDFGHPEFLAIVAATQGALWVLSRLIDERKAVLPSFKLVAAAAQHGHFDTVRFLHDRIHDERWPSVIGNLAAQSGNLELLVWLKQYHFRCFDETAYDGAAMSNHMHVVRWLSENITASCTRETLIIAAKRNNLEMLQFLHERPNVPFVGGMLVASDPHVIEWLDARRLLDIAETMDLIVGEGRADSYDWVMDRFGLQVSESNLAAVHASLHNGLLKHIYERGMAFTGRSAVFAVQFCNVDLINWAVQRDRGLIPMLVEATAKRGDPSLVEWWGVRHGVVFGQRELEEAISERNVWLAQHLLATDDVEWDLEAAREAASSLFDDYAVDGIAAIWDAIDLAEARRAAMQ